MADEMELRCRRASSVYVSFELISRLIMIIHLGDETRAAQSEWLRQFAHPGLQSINVADVESNH